MHLLQRHNNACSRLKCHILFLSLILPNIKKEDESFSLERVKERQRERYWGLRGFVCSYHPAARVRIPNTYSTFFQFGQLLLVKLLNLGNDFFCCQKSCMNGTKINAKSPWLLHTEKRMGIISIIHLCVKLLTIFKFEI